MQKRNLFRLMMVLTVFALLVSACQSQTGAPAATEKPKEVVIGVYEPMTGAQAAGGQLTMQGVNLAYETHKEVLGTPIRLVLVDNRSDKAESATAMTRLIEQEKAIAVIGSYGSSNSMAGGEVSEKAGIPVMGCSPTNPLVTAGKKFYFRACFIDPFQGGVMAKYAVETLKATKVAIIQDVAQDYSVGLASFFKQSWKELTGSEDGIVAEASYQSGDQDFTAQLGAVLAAKPDTIYAPGYFGDAALLVKQARELGFTGPIMGSDAWEAPELLSIAGDAANGVLISTHYHPDADLSPASKPFVDEFKKKYNENPSAFAALGYDAYMLVYSAIERAGSFDPTAIRDAIASTKDYPGVTGTISINETGDAVKDAVILTVENGAFKYLSTVKP
ncbi:amino acid/amide ABC transporter substrate-binding protein, HAAT family [Longilinea arvoryzae]|uniref:Amino acid/amide ABC transporter substrate-binding protein, HAAT family n=1 Tax=Longilinea arvoryzae TaxID=360412 RepID=A0A0S7BLF8_9CHLR|nr:ABC transporter substrate-binding protein [Longilinea arvoryzae]GAP14769.1 amino acid/amide ABC transporter substrate-binding protein, HAAT family [Longilinea arvoryzae]